MKLSDKRIEQLRKVYHKLLCNDDYWYTDDERARKICAKIATIILPTTNALVVCSYCKTGMGTKDMGRRITPGTITHGICEMCAEVLLNKPTAK